MSSYNYFHQPQKLRIPYYIHKATNADNARPNVIPVPDPLVNPMAALEAVEVALAVAPVGAVPEAELEVEPERLARSRKAAKLFGPDSTALIANTMP